MKGKKLNKQERKRLKLIKFFLKKIDKNSLKYLKKIKPQEQLELSKYLLISKLKLRCLEIENEFLRKKKAKKLDLKFYYLKNKISKIPAKIKLFELNMTKEEFKKINSFLKNIEENLKNV